MFTISSPQNAINPNFSPDLATYLRSLIKESLKTRALSWNSDKVLWKKTSLSPLIFQPLLLISTTKPLQLCSCFKSLCFSMPSILNEQNSMILFYTERFDQKLTVKIFTMKFTCEIACGKWFRFRYYTIPDYIWMTKLF